MAKNTGQGRRVGTVKTRSEFKRGDTWFKRDTSTARISTRAFGTRSDHGGRRVRRRPPHAPAFSMI